MIHRTLVESPKLRVVYTRRSRDEYMGRFGGGWNWMLGFKAGRMTVGRSRGATVILNLLVAMVRIEWSPWA